MGMTLEEAVKHAEEVMMENLEKTKGRNASDPTAIKCGECAEEHRQLAEWLKELKQLREQTRWIPVSERLPEKTGLYLVNIGDLVTTANFDGHNFRTQAMVRFVPDAWMPLPEPYEPKKRSGEE